jgi:ABC-type lipoprotein export system ATPase subunit
VRVLQGMEEDEKNMGGRLQLLHEVSGAFRPGVLTALVGVSGAGKTTLMDVLAGRKTGAYLYRHVYAQFDVMSRTGQTLKSLHLLHLSKFLP